MSEKMGFFIRKGAEGGKGVGSLLPLVDVAVTLITKGERILLVFNSKWGAFTLPMTKRRTWKDPASKEGAERVEEWDDAAIRAVAEWVGRTMTGEPEFLLDVAEFQQSDRDERWKRYHMQAYRLPLEDESEVGTGGGAEWLSPEEVLDEKRRPISATARYVVAELQLAGKL